MQTIFIVGPTAVGKTKLTLRLAALPWSNFSGIDILSVDSKQVFQDLNIVTGKDLDPFLKLEMLTYQSEEYLFYSKNNIRIFGIDLIPPDQDWSVSHFIRYAEKIRKLSQSQDHLLVVVGGTGLYLESLVNPPETAFIPKNTVLRFEIDQFSVESLQGKLASLNADRLAMMNNSDRQNKRRLVRAIEIEYWRRSNPDVSVKDAEYGWEGIWIGLKTSKEDLESRIAMRVRERLQHGAIDEVGRVCAKYPNLSQEARCTLGIKEIQLFLAEEISETELDMLWKTHELQYAKRQITWFTHMPYINWLEANTDKLEEKAIKIIREAGIL